MTGGAGYIGSHVVKDLSERGDEVLVVDDLSSGDAARLPAGVELVEVDVRQAAEADRLAHTMSAWGVDAVVHLAARKSVEESVRRPADYVIANVAGVAVLVDAMGRAGVRRLVFSSTAAVYGEVEGVVDEATPTHPLSPYGATKLAAENLISWTADTGRLSAASLRYFNVAGSAAPEYVERDAENLIPQVLRRLRAGERPQIFGDDYPTADGTCVRDFVHVSDVSSAHLAVLDALRDDAGHRIYNIGTGRGSSVRETIDALTVALGLDVEPEIRPRRAGDAAVVVADISKIRDEIGWTSSRTLEDIVLDASRY